MLHNLEQFTKKYIEFNAEELFTLASLFEPFFMKEDNIVIEKHENIKYLYFLDSGVLKSHKNTQDNISNVKFYFGPTFFSDLHAITSQKGTDYYVSAVKKSNVFIAKFEDVIRLIETSEKHHFFFSMIFEDAYIFNSSYSI